MTTTNTFFCCCFGSVVQAPLDLLNDALPLGYIATADGDARMMHPSLISISSNKLMTS